MCETREINDKAIISSQKTYMYLGDKNFSLNFDDDLYKIQFLLETDDHRICIH